MMAEIGDVRAAVTEERLAYLSLIREIEDFLFLEAGVLDARDWDRWLTFFDDDLKYWMPLRKNLPFKHRHEDVAGEDEVAWFDNDKDLLMRRVKQIMTGIHWAEEPLSRVTHIVTNVRMAAPSATAREGETIGVHSNFIVYRNRLEDETEILAGRREDRLLRVDGGFRIRERKVLLDQNVLTAKNLSFFF